jgi:hypothetical protein
MEQGRGWLLFGISFTARPGKEADLERVLSDLNVIRRVASHMGCTLEAVFLQGSRFTEVFDMPGAEPTLARSRILSAFGQTEVQEFLRQFAPLLDDPFIADDPTSYAAWIQRHKIRLVVDARMPEMAKPSSPPAPMGMPPQ